MCETLATGTVVQVSVSSGGVPKLPVREALVARLGLAGDGHNDPLRHGGSERAVCIYSQERISELQAEGHPISPGSTGENITVRGIDWDLVEPGLRLRLGAAVVEVTEYATPCATIRASFSDGDATRIHHALFPGYSRVYACVVEEGIVAVGDDATVY